MTRPRKTPTDLRSHRWFGKDDLRSSGHRSRARQQGYTRRRHGGQAGHRDPQYLERRQPLPRALPAARRGREARRVAGRRLPDGDPAAHARRDLHEADDDALSQPPGDGGRRSHARVSGRRRHPARRLRQDRARHWSWARRARTCRPSSYRPARCSAATGAARRSAPAPTSGSTGPSGAPARSTNARGARWKTASPARSAPA